MELTWARTWCSIAAATGTADFLTARGVDDGNCFVWPENDQLDVDAGERRVLTSCELSINAISCTATDSEDEHTDKHDGFSEQGKESERRQEKSKRMRSNLY